MRTLITVIIIVFFAGLIYQPVKVFARKENLNQFQMIRDLQSGDIILRQGKGFVSDLFRNSSLKDKQFSHAGIVHVTVKGVFVVHVLDNPDHQKPDLLKEPIAAFCDSKNNFSYAVYRYSFLSDKTSKVDRYLNRIALEHIHFDDEFNLKSDSKQYCSELIYKMCFTLADYQLPLTTFNNQSYVALDNLYYHENAKLIAKKIY